MSVRRRRGAVKRVFFTAGHGGGGGYREAGDGFTVVDKRVGQALYELALADRVAAAYESMRQA